MGNKANNQDTRANGMVDHTSDESDDEFQSIPTQPYPSIGKDHTEHKQYETEQNDSAGSIFHGETSSKPIASIAGSPYQSSVIDYDGADINTLNRVQYLMTASEEKDAVTTKKLLAFFKHKNVPNDIVTQAYIQYYQQAGLYEIIFNRIPLGFSIIKHYDNNHGIVYSIDDVDNKEAGLCIGSRVYEIYRPHYSGIKNPSYEQVIKMIDGEVLPICILFKHNDEGEDLAKNCFYIKHAKSIVNWWWIQEFMADNLLGLMDNEWLLNMVELILKNMLRVSDVTWHEL